MKKPIRPDRVAMAVMVLLAVIILPLVFRSGRSRDAELQIEDGSGQVTSENGQAAPTEDDPDPLDAPVVPAVGRFRSHVVQDGETLAQVAGELGVSTEHVMASNRLLSGSQLRPGQTVYATDEGLVHTIQAGQTLSDISKSYNAIPLARLMEANGLRADSTIFAGDRILIPGVSTSFWRHAVSLARGQAVRFIWPMEGPVRSEFGWRDHPVFGVWHHHDGIDIDVPEGTAVHAAASGKVFFYGEQPGYGNLLIIEHADGFYSFYGHLLRATVSVGQFVEMGQTVAQSGNTGDSTGPHLHFEIRNREYPVDPRLYLPSS